MKAYIRTTAKERKAIERDRAMGKFLVAHRNWKYVTKPGNIIPELEVYRKCIDFAPGAGSVVHSMDGRRYRVASTGSLVRVYV